MATRPVLSDEDRANLVAYLDGELDEPSARSLETKLNLDPAARQEAESLRLTWQMLDHLPRPEPSPSFTSRTLERVSIRQPALRRWPGVRGWLLARRWRPWVVALGWAAAVLVAGAAGFGGGKWVAPSWPAVAPAPRKEHAEQSWLQGLPRTYRDQWQKAGPEERQRLVKQWRQEDQQRQQAWRDACQHWDELAKGPPPEHLADLPHFVQWYVKEFLRPALTASEKQQLQAAEGKWPLLPETLVALADKHAKNHDVIWPGTARDPVQSPQHIKDLPAAVTQKLKEARLLQRLRPYEGKREFAWVLAGVVRSKKLKLENYKLGPCEPEDFSPPMRVFLATLERKLEKPWEKRQLESAKGTWPRYPMAVVSLANRYHLHIPRQAGTELHFPGPREYWDRYRTQPQQPKAVAKK